MLRSASATSSQTATSCRAMSMNAQLSMFDLPTWPAMSAVTGSPAGRAGSTPWTLPDGLRIGPSGSDHAPVSHGLAQALSTGATAATTTNATSGPLGSISSVSADLTRSLASRFPTPSRPDGSTPSQPTWSERTTPAGRLYLKLPQSVSRSAANASTLLPSISAREHKDSSRAEVLARLDRADGVAKRICALSPTLRSSPEIVGLNPLFAAWIMGVPSAWPLSMPPATPSMRKPPRPS